MESIKQIMAGVIDGMTHRKSQTKEELESLWRRCAKKKVAQHTKPCYVKKNTLYVNVENPAWLFEVRTKQRDFEKQITEASHNKIKHLFFKVGVVHDHSE